MISDDELLLYYYRDGLDAAERARIGAALAADPDLAQRLHKLVARLDAAAAATPEVEVPEATMHRWRTALDAATRRNSVTPIATRKRFAASQWLAAAAVLLIALVVVLQFDRQQSRLLPQVATTNAAAAVDDNAAYERGLKVHLANTEQQLASLESASPEDRARLVQQIIDQNRLFAVAADKAGEPQLARVLRAFAPVLESVAQGDNQNSAASVSQLAFELRVMQGRLAANGASPNTSTTL